MSKPLYFVNNWLLDYASGTLVHRHSGEVRRLGEYQLKLLDCLMQHAGQTLSRNELTSLVWERRVIGDNSLSNAIHALRSALEDDGKHQRVIKTIPKKGYLLDLDFCQLLEPESQSASQPAPSSDDPQWPEAEITPPAELSHALPAAPAKPNHPVAPSVIQRLRNSKRTLSVMLSLLLIALIIASSWFAFFYTSADEMVAREHEKNQYSNIRVFRIAAAVDEMGDEDVLKFKTALKNLNQKLIARDAWMSVYYRADEQMLNYTFSIESACASQQLAMSIYHWRTDNLKLTNTLYDETVRKIDELAPCKKP
ncbi:transcriptional regulator [Buttiauxella warmboldiae]|uniref:Transcriptional regulator n=1 Tax=Buttiauxella warmboldiae TaxID=82993 RepID=A0A3N5DLF5_9ENTR|nr:transcriptional regulator [Buttiauxella warmboldiae]RPH29438.1 transcriptional regulator [Buttiauxella warmboldiae]